jgi:hypothetical protein
MVNVEDQSNIHVLTNIKWLFDTRNKHFKYFSATDFKNTYITAVLYSFSYVIRNRSGS